jgi:DNA-3-methyladenine glycosylase II
MQDDYWDDACTLLIKQDRILKKIIPKYRDSGIISRGDPFLTLARSIVGQQISVAAAQSVWDRFEGLVPKITPKQVLELDPTRNANCRVIFQKNRICQRSC